jgi:hypothetical protein
MRRGVAYHLNRSTDIDTRKQLMGHRENSRAFSAYQAKTAQFDTQALLRCAEKTDVLIFSSIINGSIPGAPVSLSAAGLQVVASDPAMIKAREDRQAALLELLKEFKNVAAAKNASSPLYEVYRTAQQGMHNMQTAMSRIQFAAEVQRFAEEHRYARMKSKSATKDENTPQNMIENESSQVGESAASIENTLDCSDATTSYEEEVAALEEYQAESHGAITATRDYVIDPQLLALDKQLLDEHSATGGNDVAATEPLTPQDPPLTSRLHQVMVPRDMINSCPRPTIADGVFDRVTEGSLRHEDVDTILISLFGVKHSLTRYPPHLMPVPGTKDCSFCGVPWDEWEITNPDEKYASRFLHVKKCAHAASFAGAKSEVEAALEAAFFANDKECPWVLGRPVGPCPQTDLPDAAAWAAHLLTHRKGSRDTCRIDKCDARLTSPSVWRAHAWDKHQIPMDGLLDDIVQWCDWCEDWIIVTPASADEEAHFLSHLDHAINSIKQYGYGGCHDGTRPLVPGKCIFCFHDSELAPKDRLFLPLSQENRLTHLQKHLKSKEIGDADSVPQIFCPASAASGTDIVLCETDEVFDSESLKKHLEIEHGVACPGDSYETPYNKLKKKRAAKAAKALEAADDADASRAPLGEKSPNESVGNSRKRLKVTKTTDPDEVDKNIDQSSVQGGSTSVSGE